MKTDITSGESVVITQTGDIKSCKAIKTGNDSIMTSALSITDIATNTQVLAFTDSGLQIISTLVQKSPTDTASYGGGNFVASYDSSGTSVALGADGGHVYIAGSLPEELANSGVAYADGLVYRKDSTTLNYALSYCSAPEGISKPDNRFEYYLKDHLGSTRAVMIEGNDWLLQEATAYLAYGKMREIWEPNVSGDKAREKFTNKEFDIEGGMNLYDFGKRDYDPDIGRWISTDPKEENWNVYEYCSDNPVNLTDPDGAADDDGYSGINASSFQLDPGRGSSDLASGESFLKSIDIGAGITEIGAHIAELATYGSTYYLDPSLTYQKVGSRMGRVAVSEAEAAEGFAKLAGKVGLGGLGLGIAISGYDNFFNNDNLAPQNYRTNKFMVDVIMGLVGIKCLPLSIVYFGLNAVGSFQYCPSGPYSPTPTPFAPDVTAQNR